MTLEEASAAALRASMAGDLEALDRALEARARAIGELLQTEPSEQVRMRIKNAIGAGEFIERDLRVIKARIRVLQSAVARPDANRVVDFLA